MARLSGANLAVLWADASGTISIPTVREFVPGIFRETVDYTGGTDSVRKFRITRILANPTMRYIGFDGIEGGVAGTALRTRMAAGSVGTLLWGEHGTAVGKPKGALKVLIKSNFPVITYDSEMEINAVFLPTQGTLIADPGTAVW